MDSAPATQAGEATIVVDDESDATDLDSAFGDSLSTTSSLTSSILRYHQENGRRYHAYKPGSYVMPNDEKEQNHLDICHQMLTLAIGGNLFRAPIDKNPQRILDIGTGTGLYLMYLGNRDGLA